MTIYEIDFSFSTKGEQSATGPKLAVDAKLTVPSSPAGFDKKLTGVGIWTDRAVSQLRACRKFGTDVKMD